MTLEFFPLRTCDGPFLGLIFFLFFFVELIHTNSCLVLPSLPVILPRAGRRHRFGVSPRGHVLVDGLIFVQLHEHLPWSVWHCDISVFILWTFLMSL